MRLRVTHAHMVVDGGEMSEGDEYLEDWLGESWYVFEQSVDSDFSRAVATSGDTGLTDLIRWVFEEAKKDPEVFQKFSANLGPELTSVLQQAWETGREGHIRK